MPDQEQIKDAILENATGPASVSVAGQTTTTKSVKELIDAANFLAAQEAAAKPHFGLRFTKLIPPGGGG